MDLRICPQCKIIHVNDISFCSTKCEAEHTKQGSEELKRAFALYNLYKEFVVFTKKHPERAFILQIEGIEAQVIEEVYLRGNHWKEIITISSDFDTLKLILEKLNAA
jgi:hypothetical protein